ncbi:rhomboid family intramembrane serine protease [Desertihabitans brevis]|uniref:Rhomboid family intramembrane serine protease n=1 Tax=Desertihabitans brevis TaxID=2268447 RepID=A0A367YRK8_9ACTN|nr:rhomboid family intramembrane serine protease [Desertihabitans brevis]RCK68525.1 rhomboid family intramembrane serine protease [Desertihabitans brevis]
MVEASVGFQCPDDARRSGGVRQPRTRTGAPLQVGGRPLSQYSAAVILVGIKVVVGLADLVTGGAVQAMLASVNFLVGAGEVWRLVTHAFTSGSLLTLAINALFLFFICRSIEAEIGRWRIIAVYLLSALGSGAVLFALGSPTGVLAGGLTAVLGLLAMNTALKLRRSEDIKPDLVFLAILVVFNLVIGGFSRDVLGVVNQLLGILGGVGFGFAAGWVLGHGPREGRTRRQVLGLSGLAVLALVLVGARLALQLA